MTRTLPCGCTYEDPVPGAEKRLAEITPDPDCWEHYTGASGPTLTDRDCDDED